MSITFYDQSLMSTILLQTNQNSLLRLCSLSVFLPILGYIRQTVQSWERWMLDGHTDRTDNTLGRWHGREKRGKCPKRNGKRNSNKISIKGRLHKLLVIGHLPPTNDPRSLTGPSVLCPAVIRTEWTVQPCPAALNGQIMPERQIHLLHAVSSLPT